MGQQKQTPSALQEFALPSVLLLISALESLSLCICVLALGLAFPSQSASPHPHPSLGLPFSALRTSTPYHREWDIGPRRLFNLLYVFCPAGYPLTHTCDETRLTRSGRSRLRGYAIHPLDVQHSTEASCIRTQTTHGILRSCYTQPSKSESSPLRR